MMKEPLPATLAKYGLSVEEWRAILEAQGGVCAICGKLPPSGRLVVDHEHLPRWKKLKPEARKTTVRGVLCWICNHFYLGRSMNIRKARNVVRYLEDHHRKVYGETP